MKVLIIDDEKSLVQILSAFLEEAGYAVSCAYSGTEGLAKLRENKPDLILLDIYLPDVSGLELLPRLKSERPETSVIMITGAAALKTAVVAIKLGAEDYLGKPFDLEELELVLQGCSEKLRLKEEIETLRSSQRQQYARDYLFLSSPAMKKVYDQLEQVAQQEDLTVLISGETGTGKEHIARLAHLFSKRSAKPFVELHCAALPETLLESELFGYEAGAFTDAKKQKQGLLEAAQGGSLFLDEIGEMPLGLQTKLLKVLEQKTLRRLGGLEEIKLNVRIIAATNRELEKEVAAGRFRSDLYYRLSVVPIKIPPLRSRPEDIHDLAQFLLKEACQSFDKKLDPLSPEVVEQLKNRPWNGNVRELKNLIHRVSLLAKGPGLQVQDFVSEIENSGVPAGHLFPSLASQTAGVLSMEQAEKVNIENALAYAKGNKSEAARKLGVTRQTLLNKMRKYHID